MLVPPGSVCLQTAICLPPQCALSHSCLTSSRAIAPVSHHTMCCRARTRANTTLRLTACMVLIAPDGASHASGMVLWACCSRHKHNAKILDINAFRRFVLIFLYFCNADGVPHLWSLRTFFISFYIHSHHIISRREVFKSFTKGFF